MWEAGMLISATQFSQTPQIQGQSPVLPTFVAYAPNKLHMSLPFDLEWQYIVKCQMRQ